MAAEVIAFRDMTESAFILRSELSTLPGRDVPMEPFTAIKCLFYNIIKGSHTTEKRPMFYVAAAKKGFKPGEISNIGVVRSETKIADGITKPIVQATLRERLMSGVHSPSPKQAIIHHESDIISKVPFHLSFTLKYYNSQPSYEFLITLKTHHLSLSTS